MGAAPDASSKQAQGLGAAQRRNPPFDETSRNSTTPRCIQGWPRAPESATARSAQACSVATKPAPPVLSQHSPPTHAARIIAALSESRRHDGPSSKHAYAVSPLARAQVHVVKPVVIRLMLLGSDVAPPRRAELKHIEVVRIPGVAVAALEHAVEPPLERAGLARVPLDPVPYAEGDEGGIDVRGAPPVVAGILRQHVEPSVRAQDEELLSPGAAAAVEQEGDFVAVGTEIDRRRRLPPEARVDLTRREVVVDGCRRITLDHSLGIDKVVDIRRREWRAWIGDPLHPARAGRKGQSEDDSPVRTARNRYVACRRRCLSESPIGEDP